MTKKINHIKRKYRIVEAAFHVIYHSGFEKTTLRKIAQKAGLSLGSVQYFFPKQKDIYLFAMDVIYKRFEEHPWQIDKYLFAMDVIYKRFEKRMRNVEQPKQGAFE